MDVLPRHWIDRVHGVVPGLGLIVTWHGLWADLGRGG